MDGSNPPNLQGLLKWSLAQADVSSSSTPSISEEDRKWFLEAMQTYTVDVVKRMKEITAVLQTPQERLDEQGVSVEDLEGLLDELQEHVESIDMANDLHSIGGLVPLLEYLRHPHALLRYKAAEVVTTIVQNNPKSQKFVMDSNGLELLLTNLISDPDINVRIKTLGAISCLIRNNKPAITTFRNSNGYLALKNALTTDNIKFQRKALFLLRHLLHEDKTGCNLVTEMGMDNLFVHIASSEDVDVRKAALESLLEIVQDGEGEAPNKIDKEGKLGKLKEVLQNRINDIQQMPLDSLDASGEERCLINSLWHACYNEPSSLQIAGLLNVPGDKEPPPDVASSLLESPLRARANTQT